MQVRKLIYTIANEHDNMRVQDYLMSVHGFSRRIITRLKKTRGDITKNGEHIRMVDIVNAGDILQACLYEESYIKENAELFAPIVFEDEDVIVYNKPPNMPVHPSRNHQTDTLANAFCAHMNAMNVQATFRPINRLDRDTSGLCVVAKNALVASKLPTHFQKEYLAVICGKLDDINGAINAPIARADEFYIKRVVRPDGQSAITHYKVESVRADEKYSLVRIRLETGRTHQIRVHFAYIQHPLAGDDMYGGDCSDIKRQALCCNAVSFIHPITQSEVNLRINIHDDMYKLM